MPLPRLPRRTGASRVPLSSRRRQRCHSLVTGAPATRPDLLVIAAPHLRSSGLRWHSRPAVLYPRTGGPSAGPIAGGTRLRGLGLASRRAPFALQNDKKIIFVFFRVLVRVYLGSLFFFLSVWPDLPVGLAAVAAVAAVALDSVVVIIHRGHRPSSQPDTHP